MNSFAYHNGELFAEKVAVASIVEAVGSPSYIYSRAAIEQAWTAYDSAFVGRDHLMCYAVKANANLAVLQVLARLGSGFDIVSGGELTRALQAGGDPQLVVFSGVGKTTEEMQQALQAGILCFNVESPAELALLNTVAADLDVVAPIAIRVNPDVDAKTHPYIATGLKQNKFGIDIKAAEQVFADAAAMEHIKITGIAAHIGSQLTELDPFIESMERVLEMVDTLADNGITLEHIDLGGGLGIRYRDERPPAADEYIAALLEKLQTLGSRYQSLRIMIEPGRSIVGNAGILVTKVLYTKSNTVKNFAIVDAAMNDLMRPALYDAWQEVVPVRQSDAEEKLYDIVGPICETGDFLARERLLSLQQNDLLAVLSAGAYGAVMSSNYNARPRCPEVLVDGDRFHVVRRRESMDDLLALESGLPD